MEDGPVLRRIKHRPDASSAQDATPAAKLVERRFPWTSAARGLLGLVAAGWVISGLIGCFVALQQASEDQSGMAGMFVVRGISDFITSVTMAVILLAGAELMYGAACWLAANGAPENGETPD